MKSIVVKTSAKEAQLRAVLRNSEVGKEVLINPNFKFREFGYREIVLPHINTQDEEAARKTFNTIMHTLANAKVWVECMNVTVVTKYGQEWVKNSIGARYSGSDAENPEVRRYENLLIDGADRLGHLNNRKYRMRYDKIRWYTDGVMEPTECKVYDEEGNVVGTEAGESSLNFQFEEQGHSEQYSNYKHFRRKYFCVEWSDWDESSLVEEPVSKRVPKVKEEKLVPIETRDGGLENLSGQALFDALNAGYKRPKKK